MDPQRQTVPQLEQFQGLPSSDPDFFLDAGGRLSSAFGKLLEENAIRFRDGLPLRPLMITGPMKVGTL